MIPGSANPLLLASAAAAGVQIERSLRFNGTSDSANLSRILGASGNRKTWTWSGWVKRSKLTTSYRLFNNSAPSPTNAAIMLVSNDSLRFFDTLISCDLQTTQVLRDASAWYHILVNFDTTQATASNRVNIYINGSQVTTFATATYPSQNIDGNINDNVNHVISGGSDGVTEYLDGYLANIHFIGGQQLTPSSFTVTNGTTGQLVPKEYTGTYGTNGFNLLFADNSNNTAATLGKDTSPNGNNWTPNNLSVTTTSITYTPVSNTNLQMTWDSLLVPGNPAGMYSYDNTVATGTFAVTKSYSSLVEVLVCSTNGSAPVYVNGVSVASLPTGNNISNAAWRTALTGSGTLTSVAVQSDGPQRGIIFQVRVDGVQLVNITPAGNDSLVDTPTSYGTPDTGVGNEVRGNYTVLNALNKGSNVTLANGNLDSSHAGSSVHSRVVGTIGVTSGKWYYEATLTTLGGQWPAVGVAFASSTDMATFVGNESGTVGYYAGGGVNGGGGGRTYSTYTTNDIVGVAIDLDNSRVTFYKNGANAVTSGTTYESITASAVYVSAVSGYGSSAAWVCNFGQRAFTYTAPSGFKALCDTNIAEGTITTSGTYTGNGAADGPFVYLNGVPTAMTVGVNAVTFGTDADKLSSGFKLRTTNVSYNQNALSYSYSITTTGAKFKYARAQPNP
tara:strand:- start:8164 stop:10182 length:2019 start_codon:yes stop_codon:yes gene_type:complete